MDLLNLANGINAELSQILARNKNLLSDQDRADIFNSIVTLITDDIADEIRFYIRDTRSGKQYTGWGYDLRNKNRITRMGPSSKEIINMADRFPGGSYLFCEPVWSSKFQLFDSSRKNKILSRTIWGEVAPTNSRNELFHESPRGKHEQVNLKELEFDLLKLETETNLISKKDIGSILASVEKCFAKSYIQGIRFTISYKENSIIKWEFEIRSNGVLVRQGAPIEKVISVYLSLKGRPNIIIMPILSPQFDKMSPDTQAKAMSNTIWERDFSNQSKRNIFPW